MTSRKVVVSLVILLTGFFITLSSSEVKAKKEIKDRVAGGLAVRFNSEISENEVLELTEKFSRFGLKNPRISGRMFNLWSFNFDEDLVLDEEEFLRFIEAESSVMYADFDPIILVDHYSTPGYGEQWSYKQIELGKVWELLQNTTPVQFHPTIAVIDRGYFEFYDEMTNRFVNTGEDLPKKQIFYNFDYINIGDPKYYYGVQHYFGDGKDNDSNKAIDDYWSWNAVPDNVSGIPSLLDRHGSRVLGLMGAESYNNSPVGITADFPEIRYFPIQCADYNDSNNGRLSREAVNNAFQYVLDRRREYNTNPNTGIPFVAINCSFRVLNPSVALKNTWQDFIEDLGAEGVLTIAGSGNDSLNISNVNIIPAGLSSDYLITVTATDWNDEVPNFANTSSTKVDLAAPGVQIPYYCRTELTSPAILNYKPVMYQDFELWTGTSAATPHVTATLGLMYRTVKQDHFTSNTPSELALKMKQWLLAGVAPVDTLKAFTKTGGRLNVYNAVLNVISPAWIIDSDYTISHDIALEKRIIVDGGATLHLSNCVISGLSDNVWVEVRNGRLKITNSSINNVRIDVFGDFSKIIIGDDVRSLQNEVFVNQGSINLYNGTEMVVNRSTLYLNNTSVSADNSYFTVHTSFLNVINGTKLRINGIESLWEMNYHSILNADHGIIVLQDGGRLTVSDSEVCFTNVSTLEIIGSESGLFLDQYSSITSDQSTLQISEGANFTFSEKNIDILSYNNIKVDGVSSKVYAVSERLTTQVNGKLLITNGAKLSLSGLELSDFIINISGEGSELLLEDDSDLILNKSQLNVSTAGKISMLGATLNLSNSSFVACSGLGTCIDLTEGDMVTFF